MNNSENKCSHYDRKCRIVSPCCNKIFGCRICHDNYYEENDTEKECNIKYHKINRYEIKKIICNNCNLKQDISNKCIQCNTTFGMYYCNICNFFDNDTSKGQYHCEKCNICRVGGRENFYHCDKCNCCISNKFKDDHICIDNSLDGECPVCLENIFESVKQVILLKCGHSIHQECYVNLIKNNNIKCPVCNKSIIDNTILNNYLENEINNTPMPEIYNYNVDILCNDCNKTSNTKFHIIGHKCSFCNSYNTVQK